MSFNKSAILSLILLTGCLVENANHCAINTTVCATGQTCNTNTGRCETGTTPVPEPEPVSFSITGVSPAAIPPKFDYKNGTATITTIGKPKSKIVKVKVDQQAPIDITMQTDTPSGSQLVFPLTTLDALTKCGPLDISVVDEAGVEYPAPAELFGRFYQHWLYSKMQWDSKINVKDFEMNPSAVEPFDYIFADASGPKHVLTVGNARDFYGPFSNDLRDFDTVKYSVFNGGKAAVSVAFFTGAAQLITQLIGDVGSKMTFEPCDVSRVYSYSGFTVFSEGVNRYVQAVCEKPINSAKGRSLYLNTVGIASVIGSQRSYPHDFLDSGFYAISYPSTPGTIGALVPQKLLPLSGYSILTVDNPNREADYSNEMAITGVLPGIFSLGPTVAAPNGEVLHFVASTNLLSRFIDIQLFKGLRVSDGAGGTTIKQMGGLVKAVDPVAFGEDRTLPTISSAPIGIEVRDINCDKYYDIILRTNKVVVAYLGNSPSTWNWDAPKVLFKATGNDPSSGIRKQALWVPAYQNPDDRGVLGVLERNNTLQMYQQE